MNGLTKAEKAACQNEGRVAWRDMDSRSQDVMLKHRAWLEVWYESDREWKPSMARADGKPCHSDAYRLSPDAPTVDDAPTLGVMPRKLWLENRVCELALAVERRVRDIGRDGTVADWAAEMADVAKEAAR